MTGNVLLKKKKKWAHFCLKTLFHYRISQSVSNKCKGVQK